MNSKTILNFCRHTALALAIFSSAQVFAQDQVVDKVVAIVDNGVILQSDLNAAVAQVQAQFKAQQKPLPSTDELRKEVFNQLVLREAQSNLVQRYGVQPSENALNAAMSDIAKAQGLSSLEALQKKLGEKQYQAVRSQVAMDIAISQIRQQQVLSRIQISDKDIDNFLKSPQGQAALGNQVHLLHFVISPKNQQNRQETMNYAQQVRLALMSNNDIAAIQQQFAAAPVNINGKDLNYRALSDIPADLAARVSSLTVGQTTDPIVSQDGIHLFKVLERKAGEQKAIIPEYQTRHILIQTSDSVSPADAKQRIEQLYQRLKNGEKFSTLAATYSNDTASAREGGSLGWVVPGMMVPEFDKVMQETPVGQISQPFQTQYGWHILTVEDKRQTDRTEEYQRRMAKQILTERQFDSEMDNWLRELRNNAYVDIKDPSLKD